MSGDNNDPIIPLDAKAAGEAPSASHGAGNGAMPPQPPPDLTEIRKQLFTRGYKILPNRGKAPVIKGWSDPDYLARELTDSGKGNGAGEDRTLARTLSGRAFDRGVALEQAPGDRHRRQRR